MKNITLMFIIALLTACAGYFQPAEVPGSEAKPGLNGLALSGGGYLSSLTANERSPFVFRPLEGNPVLLYSSDRDGSYDIYSAELMPDGTFLPPVKLGPGINTDDDELYPATWENQYTNRFLAFMRVSATNNSFWVALVTNGYNVEYWDEANRDVSPYKAMGPVIAPDGGFAGFFMTDGTTNMNLLMNSDGWLWDTKQAERPVSYFSGFQNTNDPSDNFVYITPQGKMGGYIIMNDASGRSAWFDYPMPAAKDADPTVDAATRTIYFASQRRGAQWDLYRYNESTFEKLKQPVLAPPQNVTLPGILDFASDGPIAVMWSPVTNATGYRVFKYNGPDPAPSFYLFTEVGTTSATNFTDTTGGVMGQTYFYIVQPYGPSAVGPASTAVSGQFGINNM